MKLILQKVKSSKLSADGENYSQINKGYLILLGITKDCNFDKIDWMAKKILKLRIFPEEGKNFKKSIVDVSGDIMVVSNFTVPGILDANKPNFKHSASFEDAEKYYEKFVEILKKESDLKIETGKFGAMMEIDTILDGPFNLVLEK